MTQLQFNDIYGYFRKKNDHGLPQWLESDETIASPDQVQLRVQNGSFLVQGHPQIEPPKSALHQLTHGEF